MAGHIAHCMRGDVCIELPHLEEVKNATPYDMDTD